VVSRNIPVWEFREGMAAVNCWNGCEAEGWFGRVYLQSSNPRVVTADGARHDLDLVSVVRIGKVVGKWPGLSSLCNDAGLIKTKARTARVKLCSIAVADVAKKVRLP